jgi:hypothetical protein
MRLSVSARGAAVIEAGGGAGNSFLTTQSSE